MISWDAYVDEFTKLAATRLDKEIAKGTVTPQQVWERMKANKQVSGPLPQSMWTSKSGLRAGMRAPVHAAHAKGLKRRREIAGRSAKAIAKSQKVQPFMMPLMGPAALFPHKFDLPKHKNPVVNEAIQAVAKPGAKVSPHSGSWVRKITELTDKPGSLKLPEGLKALAATLPIADRALLKKQPVDKTLYKKILGHELGEMQETKAQPHASHRGMLPRIREQYPVGDPRAEKVMSKLRKLAPDDKLVTRLMTQAGGTPDRPIPEGGKQHRALRRMVDRNVTKLTPKARKMALGHEAKGERVSYVPDRVRREVATLKDPARLKAKFETMSKERLLKDPIKALSGAAEAGNVGYWAATGKQLPQQSQMQQIGRGLAQKGLSALKRKFKIGG